MNYQGQIGREIGCALTNIVSNHQRLLSYMDGHRKQSEDLYDSEEEGADLFPRHSHSNLKLAIELLTESYRREEHAWQLANCCFKCHLPAIQHAYNELKNKVDPELRQSPISNLYANEQFVDLRQVTVHPETHSITLPDPFIQPVPLELGKSLDQLYQRYGYIPNLERFLLFYPTYLQKHRIVEADLFESGKIEAKSAYFVALCGAAQMGSVYMMCRYLKMYLKSGGQTEWFTQEKYPPKLAMLSRLNSLMARSPWDIVPQTIEDILDSEEIYWNRNELALYVQIMAFAHQNSTIALSVGLLPEEEGLLGQLRMGEILNMKQKYDKIFYQTTYSKEKLAVMIPMLNELTEEDVDRSREFKIEMIESKNALRKQVKSSEAVETYMKEINTELTKQEMYRVVNKCVSPLLWEFRVVEKRGNENKKAGLDYSEYNYKFMAYPILNSMTHDTADKVLGLIDYSQIMSRGNFGSVNINQNRTKQFRKAVRYYAQNLCGYTHLEYDFKNNVSEGLTMALKFYVRLVMMSPLHISQQVVRATNHQSGRIECFDLGHLAVMVANTKMSLQLMLAVQAFEV